jgi:hypothetical protein
MILFASISVLLSLGCVLNLWSWRLDRRGRLRASDITFTVGCVCLILGGLLLYVYNETVP